MYQWKELNNINRGLVKLNELILKINQILKVYNNTFDISPITEDGEETTNIKIEKIKNDGTEFNDEFFNFFNEIIKNLDSDYEMIYNKDKGLVIVKKIVTYNLLEEE